MPDLYDGTEHCTGYKSAPACNLLPDCSKDQISLKFAFCFGHLNCLLLRTLRLDTVDTRQCPNVIVLWFMRFHSGWHSLIRTHFRGKFVSVHHLTLRRRILSSKCTALRDFFAKEHGPFNSFVRELHACVWISDWDGRHVAVKGFHSMIAARNHPEVLDQKSS